MTISACHGANREGQLPGKTAVTCCSVQPLPQVRGRCDRVDVPTSLSVFTVGAQVEDYYYCRLVVEMAVVGAGHAIGAGHNREKGSRNGGLFLQDPTWKDGESMGYKIGPAGVDMWPWWSW